MDEGTARFHVSGATTGNAVTLTITGAIDAHTRRAAGTGLREAVATLPPPGVVVIDVTSVGFFAAAGVHLVTDIAALCTHRGLRVRLAATPDTLVEHAIRIAGLDRHIPVFPTVADAVEDS
jgi:anti-anti-sigma factor